MWTLPAGDDYFVKTAKKKKKKKTHTQPPILELLAQHRRPEATSQTLQ